MKIAEFRQYLTIDKLALDEAVIHQAALFYEVSEACAEAIANRDALKEELDAADAMLDTKARRKLNDPKEAQVKAYIRTATEHQDALLAYLDAKAEAEKLTGLKDAFKQRAQALRILADLYASNYFDDAAIKTSASQDRVVYHSTRAKMANRRK
jgi:hypothetical protein